MMSLMTSEESAYASHGGSRLNARLDKRLGYPRFSNSELIRNLAIGGARLISNGYLKALLIG
jgi:hypothetical protein